MNESSDDLDEVALNVLLAEGLDVSTAWEASRRDAGSESAALGRSGVLVLVVVAVAVLAFVLF